MSRLGRRTGGAIPSKLAVPVAIPQQIALSNCLAQKRGQARSALAGDGEEW